MDFLELVWSYQSGEGFGFVSYRRDATSWLDIAIRYPDQLGDFKLPDPTKGDLYFTPNFFERPRRRKPLVMPSTLLYADLDEVDPKTLKGPLRPQIAWQSSKGRYAAIWVMDRPLPPEDHQLLNKKLTYKLGADKGGWDATQVLRLPGTLNHKRGKPEGVKLLWSE